MLKRIYRTKINTEEEHEKRTNQEIYRESNINTMWKMNRLSWTEQQKKPIRQLQNGTKYIKIKRTS